MMMHDEGTALYDLFATPFKDYPILIVLLIALAATVLVSLLFVSKMIDTFKQREIDRDQAEAEALLDLQHRGEWHA